MEYSIKPKSLGERRIIHYPQKRIIGLYVTYDKKKNNYVDSYDYNLMELCNDSEIRVCGR